MKLSTSILIGVAAAWSESDYPGLQFKCTDSKGEQLFEDGVPFCKWIKCKLFPKLKVINKQIPGVPTDVIHCPTVAESGCETEWNMKYQVGKKLPVYQLPLSLVPPNQMKHSSKTGKLTITCMNTEVSSKAFCRPVYKKNETPARIEFTWQKGSLPACAEPGESWATWTSWASSSASSLTCERGTATRTRQCLDGPHPGSPTSCVEQPLGPSTEVKTFWPNVCQKCHADFGLWNTPGHLNPFHINVPSDVYMATVTKEGKYNKYDDGFVKLGLGVTFIKCHDDPGNHVQPYTQKCVCDEEFGCRLGDAPLCQGADYKDYGVAYFWQPGAKDTWKDDETTGAVTIKDNFELEYAHEADDKRFANRVTWWDGGPSICRYWTNYALLPGMEKPTNMNAEENADDKYWLECDTYVEGFPSNFGENITALAKGEPFYEVLTTDSELVWVLADDIENDDDIEDRMVIVGNSEEFARKYHGLCRLSSCTVAEGGECHEQVPWWTTTWSGHLVEHLKVYPGLLYWVGDLATGKWKCQNLFVIGDLVESEQTDKFEVLLKQTV